MKKIDCLLLKRKINLKDCQPLSHSSNCQICPLKDQIKPKKPLKSTNSKAKYRRKPYTPPRSQPSIDKASEQLKAIYKNQKTAFAQRMVELAEKGVRISEVAHAIAQVHFKWEKKTGTFDLSLALKGPKEVIKDERLIRNAIRLLTEGFKPVLPDCLSAQHYNYAMDKMKTDLEAIFQRYKPILDYYFYLRRIEPNFDVLVKGMSYKSDGDRNADLNAITTVYPLAKIEGMFKQGVKPAKQSSHGLFNDCISVIVEKLKKAGYSYNQSYIETGELLYLCFPRHYTDKNPNLVRLRYLTQRKRK